MKIALLTIHDHWSMNYGAVLQTYATVRVLKELGHEVTLVDLVLSNDRKKSWKLIFALGKLFKFRRFARKYYPPLTRRYRSVAELRADPPRADIYLVGSDQVWNPRITTCESEAFFLDFGDAGIPRIAFASSFGEAWEGSPGQTAKVRGLLGRFSSVMVREEISLRQCVDVFGLGDVSLVPDPTLVAGEFGELTAAGGKRSPDGQIVVYEVGKTTVCYKRAVEVGRERGMSIRGLSWVRYRPGTQPAPPVGVEEWVARIASAPVVFTDSFHGMVFSILYRRNFVVFATGKRSGRQIHLARTLGLENRVCDNTADTGTILKTLDTPVDWDVVHARLADMRVEAVGLLKKAIEGHA